MSDTPLQERPPRHEEAVTPGAQAPARGADSQPRRFAPFVAVAAVSLVIGAVGGWLALRTIASGSAADVTTPQEAAATTGAPAASTEMPGMDMGGGAAGTKGKGVYIAPARQQLIGVRTATVTRRPLNTTIRTVGTLAYDETRVTEIHPKITGWVERVFVDYVGKRVSRGQPLFTIYSPELVSTQKEYLLSLKARQQLGNSRFTETREGAESLVAAARERLTLWDITEAQIEELERTSQPRRTLTLYSPFDGVVLERNTFAGQYITPETSTFKIADLSTIWVLGQIFEYELPLLKLGQEAEIQFPYGQSTRNLKGRITFVYPEVDPQTRRVKVRIEFRNAAFEFKPESYVTVLIRAGAGEQLALPKEAVLDNGAKRYAIVALPNGYFEPREIEVGQPVDDFFPVIRGLAEGDPVVTSAQFLIDSETNLQSAMQAMSMSMPGMNMGGAKPGTEGTPPSAPPAAPVPPADHSQHK
jgi:membrane fusion protein, copper/silver efflux system